VLAPALGIFAASLVMALPVPLAWGVMPHLPLVLVMLWATVQPRLLPPSAAFLLGLAHDAVAGAPIGLFALVFLLMVVAVRVLEHRSRGAGVALAWLPACGLVLAAFLLTWQIQQLLLRPVPLGPHAVQALLTCLAIPAMLRLVALQQRRLTEGLA
jgi:rod shape-determining protein MreD